MYTTQSKMISRAIWVEKKHVWKINLQKNGVRKSFYSSVPGDKGRKICAQNATSWLSGACPFSVSERTTVDTVFERYLQDKALETTNIYTIRNRYNNHIKPIIGKVPVMLLTKQDLKRVIYTAYRKHNLSQKSLKNIRGDLSGFCNYLDCADIRNDLRTSNIDLNKICAVPVHLNIGPDDEVSCGEKLYRHYLDLVPYPTEEEEENFLAVLSRADQRRFLLGKMAVLNRKEYGYPTYTGWCTEHWGTDENVISFEECNENSIAFLTHSAPASEAIHTLSILFPKVKLTFAWEENKVALMDDEVVLHYEVYRYGELAESKSAIAGKTHWQYNGSLKKPLYCTPQEDNDYGEIPEGISAEDFEEPDAMPF